MGIGCRHWSFHWDGWWGQHTFSPVSMTTFACMPRVFMLLFSSLGAVAQLGARLNGIQKVKGSNPFSSTTFRTRISRFVSSCFCPFDRSLTAAGLRCFSVPINAGKTDQLCPFARGGVGADVFSSCVLWNDNRNSPANNSPKTGGSLEMGCCVVRVPRRSSEGFALGWPTNAPAIAV